MRPVSHSLGSTDRLPLRVTSTAARPLRRRPEGESRRAMVARLLYDAALQRTSWAVAIVEIVDLFCGSGGYLVLRRDGVGQRPCIVDGWVFAPAVDGRAGGLFPAGTVRHDAGARDDAGWGAAALQAIDGDAGGAGEGGLTTAVRLAVELEDGLVAELVVRRPAALGPQVPWERRLVGWLESHLPDALSLYVGVRRLHADKALYQTVLDRMSRAVFLINRSGRVFHANAAARRMAASLDSVDTSGGRLAIGDPTIRAQVRRAVVNVTGSAAGNGAEGTGAAEAPVDLVVPLDGHPRPLLVRVLAVGGGDAVPRQAAAIVELRDMNAEPARNCAMLQSAFGLSRAEAEIALAVADGIAPKAIARDRDVAPSTIRTQLLSTYRKCGVSRQGELSALVARFIACGGFDDRG